MLEVTWMRVLDSGSAVQPRECRMVVREERGSFVTLDGLEDVLEEEREGVDEGEGSCSSDSEVPILLLIVRKTLETLSNCSRQANTQEISQRELRESESGAEKS